MHPNIRKTLPVLGAAAVAAALAGGITSASASDNPDGAWHPSSGTEHAPADAAPAPAEALETVDELPTDAVWVNANGGGLAIETVDEPPAEAISVEATDGGLAIMTLDEPPAEASPTALTAGK